MIYRNADGSMMSELVVASRQAAHKKRESVRKANITRLSRSLHFPENGPMSVEAYVRIFERRNLLVPGDYGDALAGMNEHADFVEIDLPVEVDQDLAMAA